MSTRMAQSVLVYATSREYPYRLASPDTGSPICVHQTCLGTETRSANNREPASPQGRARKFPLRVIPPRHDDVARGPPIRQAAPNGLRVFLVNRTGANLNSRCTSPRAMAVPS